MIHFIRFSKFNNSRSKRELWFRFNGTLFYPAEEYDVYILHGWAVREEDLEDFIYFYDHMEAGPSSIFVLEDDLVLAIDYQAADRFVTADKYQDELLPEAVRFDPELHCIRQKEVRLLSIFGDEGITTSTIFENPFQVVVVKGWKDFFREANI